MQINLQEINTVQQYVVENVSQLRLMQEVETGSSKSLFYISRICMFSFFFVKCSLKPVFSSQTVGVAFKDWATDEMMSLSVL